MNTYLISHSYWIYQHTFTNVTTAAYLGKYLWYLNYKQHGEMGITRSG